MTKARLALAAAALLAALPWILRIEPRTLGEESRRRLPCTWANLKDGRTCFDLEGKPPAEVVVFVHGFNSPSYVWGKLPSMLREAGYMTMTYDLFGRGGSDRPWADYDLDLYERQLDALMRKTGLHRPVHLVGLSMGGIIAAEFALRRSDLVASLTLIDPAGFQQQMPPLTGLLTMPLVGDWLMQVFGGRIALASHADLLHDKYRVGDLLRQFEPQFEIAGSRRALLSTLRNMPLADFTERYAELGRTTLPIEVIWGRDDEVTPFANSALAMHLLPKARLDPIDGAGHLAHYEQPDLVMDRLLPFLRSVDAPLQEGPRAKGAQQEEDGIEQGAAKKDCGECAIQPVRRDGSYSKARVGKDAGEPGAASGAGKGRGERRPGERTSREQPDE